MQLTRRALDDLSERVAVTGVAANWTDIEPFVTTAAIAGAPVAALDALTDPTLPEVVRQRAFGRAAVAVSDPRPAAAAGRRLVAA
jgi:hypothetical protein